MHELLSFPPLCHAVLRCTPLCCASSPLGMQVDFTNLHCTKSFSFAINIIQWRLESHAHTHYSLPLMSAIVNMVYKQVCVITCLLVTGFTYHTARLLFCMALSRHHLILSLHN